MTKQKGICLECGVEYEYDYNPKFPRKYCPECSAKKKQEWEDNQGPGELIKQPEDPKPEVVRPGEKVIDNSFDLVNKENEKYTKPKRGPYDKDPVGLAVDIFCATCMATEEDGEVTMAQAIARVKQAQKELS
ncbi:MAG TPA: hypothetical protein ENI23_13775 [bacterium]|nr:hypothetical protein [bacterium]